MSLINVTNIKIGNNVCNIKLPLIFQIEFECLENLKHDVEWKIIYITSDGKGYNLSDLASSSTSSNTHSSLQTKDGNSNDCKDSESDPKDSQNGPKSVESSVKEEKEGGDTSTDDTNCNNSNNNNNDNKEDDYNNDSNNNSANNKNNDEKDEKEDNLENLELNEEYIKLNNRGEIILDAVCLGPIHKGILEFEFRVNPPNFNKLDVDSILGMQAILISGNYCDQEFIRIGYYTHNTYDDALLRENPPDVPDLDRVVRCIIDQPRVTRFPIRWDSDDLVDYEGNRLNF